LDAAADACEDEESEAPDPGHSSGHFLGEIVSFATADGAEESSTGLETLVVVWRHIAVGVEALSSVGVEALSSIGIEALSRIRVESLVGWNIRPIVIVGLVEAALRRVRIGIADAWGGRGVLVVEERLVGNIGVVVGVGHRRYTNIYKLLDLSLHLIISPFLPILNQTSFPIFSPHNC
jgi:hypothetical protein